MAGCSSSDAIATYPDISNTYSVSISSDELQISGVLTYLNSNNITFTYNEPEYAKGFDVKINGGVYEITMGELSRKCNGTPFSKDSPIALLIDIFKLIEQGNATETESTENISKYKVDHNATTYTIEIDSTTGAIRSIYSDKLEIMLKKTS
ncbi:MAG: hypothetical protein PUC88_00010 [Clostridia bacterium]|nr:hypothetical protein [Clostridia bacterium]